MTKSKTVERVKASQNLVTTEIKRREAKLGEKITKSVKKVDEFAVSFMNAIADPEKGELVIGGADQFENDKVLKILGFEKNSDGVLVLQAEPNEELNTELVSFEEEKKKREEQKEENELGA